MAQQKLFSEHCSDMLRYLTTTWSQLPMRRAELIAVGVPPSRCRSHSPPCDWCKSSSGDGTALNRRKVSFHDMNILRISDHGVVGDHDHGDVSLILMSLKASPLKVIVLGRQKSVTVSGKLLIVSPYANICIVWRSNWGFRKVSL